MIGVNGGYIKKIFPLRSAKLDRNYSYISTNLFSRVNQSIRVTDRICKYLSSRFYTIARLVVILWTPRVASQRNRVNGNRGRLLTTKVLGPWPVSEWGSANRSVRSESNNLQLSRSLGIIAIHCHSEPSQVDFDSVGIRCFFRILNEFTDMNRKRVRCTVKFFDTHILSSALFRITIFFFFRNFSDKSNKDPFVRVENIFWSEIKQVCKNATYVLRRSSIGGGARQDSVGTE